MRLRRSMFAFLLLAVSAAPLHAQLPISVDVSGGPAKAGGNGAGGAAFVSLTLVGIHARLGGEVFRTGASAGSDSSARTIASSAGVGLIMPGLLIPRPYALIIGGQGIDWRENDDHILMTGPFALDYQGTIPPELLQAAPATSG